MQTVKPLSSQERAVIKTLCVVSELNEYFVYCKYHHGTEVVPSKRISEYVLNVLKSDLREKGYTLTDNPNAADYRLVLKPQTVRFWGNGAFFDGVAISSAYSDIYAYAAFILGLVNPNTGSCRISRKMYWFE